MTRLSIIVLDDYQTLSRAAADIVTRSISAKPTAALVAATGETPMGLYRELARRRDEGAFDASSVRVFQLDEYAEIGPEDRRSLFGWTMRSLVWPLGISDANTIRLPTDGDITAGCAAYDRAVEEAGGYDLAILGIGSNGHIGFNEPPSDRSAPTREVALSPESIEANARYWGGRQQVPSRAVTAGMPGLLHAHKTLLLASGGQKREIVRRALQGPMTPEVPASYLQSADDVTVLLDRRAWNGSAVSAGPGDDPRA